MVTSRLQGAKFGAGQWVKLIFRIQKSPLGGVVRCAKCLQCNRLVAQRTSAPRGEHDCAIYDA
jgi:hypothetical protein